MRKFSSRLLHLNTVLATMSTQVCSPSLFVHFQFAIMTLFNFPDTLMLCSFPRFWSFYGRSISTSLMCGTRAGQFPAPPQVRSTSLQENSFRTATVIGPRGTDAEISLPYPKKYAGRPARKVNTYSPQTLQYTNVESAQRLKFEVAHSSYIHSEAGW